MPDGRREQLHPHLLLLREDRSAERRKRPAPPVPPPGRGGRGAFSPRLKQAAERILELRHRRPTPPFGIQPHLVFRVPFAEGASVDQLIDSLQRQAGLEIVSVEPDRAVIAFRDNLDLQEFQDAVNRYE